MPSAHHTVPIACDPAAAFAFVEDLANHDRWLNGHLSTRWEGEGPVAVGRVCRETIEAPGGPWEDVAFEVIEHAPPRRIGYRCGGFWKVRGAEGFVEVAPADGGCTVTYALTVEFGGWMRLLSPLMGSAIKDDIKKSLATLQRVLESGA